MRLCIILLLILIPVIVFAQQPGLNRYFLGIHYDSNISGGHYSPEKLVQLARENGVDAVVFCDHDRMEAEYGLPPLRNLVKKRIEYPSIFTYGVKNYFNLIDTLNKRFPRITLLAGAEIAPAYYWSGDPFHKNLCLNNWHQHMLLIGQENPLDLEKIPSTASNLREDRFNKAVLYDGAALLGLILGIMLSFKVVRKEVVFSGQRIRLKRRPFKLIGFLIALFCLALLVNDFPFKEQRFSPYRGDPNPEVSQAVIDFALSQGALVYYAHPEAEFSGEINGVNLRTEPYSHLLLETQNYTGFAVFAEGWKQTGAPAGEWDQVLYQYCNGQREKPAWVIGEVDFEGDLPAEFLREVGTFLWAKDNSRQSILDALANGRCYAAQIWGPNFIWLDDWCLIDSLGQRCISGETLKTQYPLKLHFEFTVAEDKDGFEVMVIRNGRQLAIVPFDQSLTLDLPDDPPQGKTYYRLWVLYRGTPVLATNPIFVVKA